MCQKRDGGHDLYDDGDDLSKPLTREELQGRIMDGVRKKEIESAREPRTAAGGDYGDLSTTATTTQKQKSKK